jgi:hypothetical protein
MQWLKSPLLEVLLLTAALAILQPVYALFASVPGPAPRNIAEVIFRYALPYTIVLWIVADAKERRSTPCFDFGFFALATWPVSLFWYCISSRGWRGLGLAAGLMALACVPLITTFALALLLAIGDAILQQR